MNPNPLHYIVIILINADEIKFNLFYFLQEAIVFMVGGGNYIEYQNLMDHANSKGTSSLTSGLSSTNLAGMNTMTGGGASNQPQKRIIYGCTTLHNANQMMQQLQHLGKDL